MVSHTDRRGLRDWLAQRVTAVIIGVYALVVVIFLLAHPHVTYGQWQALYSNLWMRIFTVITALSICWHAWIGLWTVFTDYVKNKPVRFVLQVLVVLLLLAYLVWVVEILWA